MITIRDMAEGDIVWIILGAAFILGLLGIYLEEKDYENYN